MRRLLFNITALVAISGSAVGQATSADSQTLQALLSEVRALRQDLRVSLNRAQTMQILLARFQIQEEAITRASDHLTDARQKLLETHSHQQELTLAVKRLEDSLISTESSQQQADLQDRIKKTKSDLDIANSIAQQQHMTEMRAEQVLRDEQDKLGSLETQLDELTRAVATSNEKAGANRP